MEPNYSGLAVFIGKSRPFTPRDTGKILLFNLSKAGHSIAGVFLYPGDPLFEWSRERFPTYNVHPFLTLSFSEMKKTFDNGSIPPEFDEWTTWFKTQYYKNGLSFFSGWIPPSIFGSFPTGIVNFHPGPLPELPGYEPETMAVLLGLDEFSGTLHIVEEKFDAGRILWHSPQIKIGPNDGPVRILYNTTLRAVRELPKVLNKLFLDTLPTTSVEGRSRVLYASSKACRRFAVIDWLQDGVETILRKNRAFNEQEISLDLIAHVFGEIFVVEDARPVHDWERPLVVVYQNTLSSTDVGEKVGFFRGLGRFRGAPVFNTLTGLVVLRLRNPSFSPAARTRRIGNVLRNQPAQLEKIL